MSCLPGVQIAYQFRQVILNGVPDYVEVDIEVEVSNLVPHASDFDPSDFWR
jgi:hypothetical protein